MQNISDNRMKFTEDRQADGCHTACNKIWLPWLRLLGDQRTNFRVRIYIYSSTEPKNLAKFGPVDFAIIGLIWMVKNERISK